MSHLGHLLILRAIGNCPLPQGKNTAYLSDYVTVFKAFFMFRIFTQLVHTVIIALQLREESNGIQFADHSDHIDRLIDRHAQGEFDRQDFEQAMELSVLNTNERAIRRINRVDIIDAMDNESRIEAAKELVDKLPNAKNLRQERQ